jgi:hypothetical protein
MKTILLIGVILFIGACSPESSTSSTEKKTIIVNGAKYTLIRKSSNHDEVVSNVELWEKEGVTNRYYTPSLTGRDMLPILK